MLSGSGCWTRGDGGRRQEPHRDEAREREVEAVDLQTGNAEDWKVSPRGIGVNGVGTPGRQATMRWQRWGDGGSVVSTL